MKPKRTKRYPTVYPSMSMGALKNLLKQASCPFCGLRGPHVCLGKQGGSL